MKPSDLIQGGHALLSDRVRLAIMATLAAANVTAVLSGVRPPTPIPVP